MKIRMRAMVVDENGNIHGAADGEPIPKEGEEAHITMQEITKVMSVMPKRMSIAGLCSLFINMIGAYDHFDKSGQLIVVMLQVLAKMKEDQPELFEEGGARRERDKLREDFQKNLN